MTSRTVVSLLRKICIELGERTALVGTKDVSLTYQELGTGIQALSWHLQQNLGITKGHAIGVCMDRCFQHIVTILAVLDARAAFVPLDPNFPHNRLAYIVHDANLRIIVAQRKYFLDLQTVLDMQDHNCEVIYIDDLLENITCLHGQSRNVSPRLRDDSSTEPDPEDVANIMYTSGSTGEPKGVVILHKGLIALSLAVGEAWELRKPESRMLQFASHCFDASTSEILATLCSGATLVLGSREELLPGKQLAAYLRSQEVTAVLLPPSVLATLNEFRSSLPSLRIIIAGGEACSVDLARTWATSSRRFINAYGPTECTVISTMYVVDGGADDEDLKTVPLGEPLPGYEVHLLNDHLEAVKNGEVGEIFIGGVGVCGGYLHKPDLTARYFIPHPQTKMILYRSGDLGVRRGPRNHLEFAGRIDNQIKINGYRVELGAVEQILCRHSAVEHAVVKAVEASKDGSNQILVAYVVLHQKDVDKVSRYPSDFLKYYLLDGLPSYMVPLIYMFMDALPLTLNGGKIDRKALPHPYLMASSGRNLQQYTSAADEGEGDHGLNTMLSQCCGIFERVLNLESGFVQVDSNFFHLGGNSLWCSRLATELGEAFGLELLPWQIYKQPTPQQLVFWILQMQKLQPDSLTLQDVSDVELLNEAHSLEKSLQAISSSRGEPKVVLLTGATGFLGVHLLENLLVQGPFKTIYCLVRAETVVHAWNRVQATRQKYGVKSRLSNTKIVMLIGDIQDDNMGLSGDSYSELSNQINLIYHVAADTNYIRPYAEMRQPNVEGTRQVLHFAATCPSLKALHYVSTIGIYGGLSGFTHDVLGENLDIESCLSFLHKGETGYTKSKWVAEIMVLDFKSRGFPVSIYRPGFIEAHSCTGVANSDDTLCRFIQGCSQMGSYPVLRKKYWVPIPVDFAADAISYLSLNSEAGKIYNLVPDRKREMDNKEIFQALREDYHLQLEELSMSNWVEALSSVPASNSLYPLIGFLSQKVHESRYTVLELPVTKLDCTNTREGLRGSGIEIPGFDRYLLGKYVQFLGEKME